MCVCVCWGGGVGQVATSLKRSLEMCASEDVQWIHSSAVDVVLWIHCSTVDTL